MTHFIHTRVDIGGGRAFVIDGNSKITAGNGTYANPAPNALSLPAASVSGRDHCPGSTDTCRASCYVRGLAKYAPDVYAAYEENAATLDVVLRDLDEGLGVIFVRSAHALGAWITEHAPDGFRWHVSGDVRGATHAQWIASVCRASPTVRHWIYTRTLDSVSELSLAPNLAVNVSADRDNWRAARNVAREYGARLCYMAVDDYDARSREPHLPDGSVVFPDYPLRGRDLPDPTEHPYWKAAPHRLRVLTCPADFFGQSEAHRCGPCDRCLRPTGARS